MSDTLLIGLLAANLILVLTAELCGLPDRKIARLNLLAIAALLLAWWAS